MNKICQIEIRKVIELYRAEMNLSEAALQGVFGTEVALICVNSARKLLGRITRTSVGCFSKSLQLVFLDYLRNRTVIRQFYPEFMFSVCFCRPGQSVSHCLWEIGVRSQCQAGEWLAPNWSGEVRAAFSRRHSAHKSI